MNKVVLDALEKANRMMGNCEPFRTDDAFASGAQFMLSVDEKHNARIMSSARAVVFRALVQDAIENESVESLRLILSGDKP